MACAISYGNFLLCDYNHAVDTSDPHRRQAALSDGFKGIFCKKEEKCRLKLNKPEDPPQMCVCRLQHASLKDLARLFFIEKPSNIPNRSRVGSVPGFKGPCPDSDEAKLPT